MKLETIDDLLQIDHEKLKVAETKRLLTKIKQLIKNSPEKQAKTDLPELPYRAVSVVGNKLVHLSFNLKTGEARVMSQETDSRDIKGKNLMAASKAMDLLEKLVRDQREK